MSNRKRPMHILIDGYNLLHAIGFRGNLADPGRLERARLEMLNKLAVYLTPSERSQTVVVFDRGRRRKDRPQRYVRHDIRVEFAIGFEDADTMIESLIRRHAVPQKLLVVSSDHRIQIAARRRKADFVDSDDWIDQLESSTPLSSREKTKGGKPKFREGAEYWLDFFKADDLESLLEDSDAESESVEQEGPDILDPEPGKKDSYNPFPEGYGDDLLELD